MPRWVHEDYEVDSACGRLDFAAVQRFLCRSYWAEGISLEIVEAACAGSLCFGLYREDEQVGFARVISDRVTFGYLADVYVLEDHRGRGLSKWLVECVLAHPELQSLRRFMLATRDAHGLYERYGFAPLANPKKFMEIARPSHYAARPSEARQGLARASGVFSRQPSKAG